MDKDLSDKRLQSRLNYLREREAKKTDIRKKLATKEEDIFVESINSNYQASLIEDIGSNRVFSSLDQRTNLEDDHKEPSWYDLQIKKAKISVDIAHASLPISPVEPKASPVAKMDQLAEKRRLLPVFEFKNDIINAINQFQVLILVGETGSGKTTQIPQYLKEAGFCGDGKVIACTQPRRVAAMSVASRVADEMGCVLGAEVGYSIRFEDCTSSTTQIKYMTDGMLLRELMISPDLAKYSVIMVDEAHERTVNTDILFALLKDLCSFRPDFKLLVSSATLDAQKFSEYFDNAPIFTIPGRPHEIEVFYTKQPESDYISAAIISCLQIHASGEVGDILVFLPGQEEIEGMEEELRIRRAELGVDRGNFQVVTIYANLPSELQAMVFLPAPAGHRKIILATNIAETSITIDGIKFVVDSGFCKLKTYSPRTNMETLAVKPCSQASCNQRAGRAGRIGSGKCFRLFTQWTFDNDLEPNITPEILRSNLGSIILLLKTLGIHDIVNFDFMDSPSSESIINSLELLYSLGALNSKGELTTIGRKMAEFPLDPMMAKVLIAAGDFGCSEDVCIISSMLSIQGSVFFRPKAKKEQADRAHKSFHSDLGDHFTLLNVYRAWEESGFSKEFARENFIQLRSLKSAKDVFLQLKSMLLKLNITLATTDASQQIQKAFAYGFKSQVARISVDKKVYLTAKGNVAANIHPSSSLFKRDVEVVLYNEIVETSKIYLRNVMVLEESCLGNNNKG